MDEHNIAFFFQQLKDDTPEVLIGESLADEVEEEHEGKEYEVGEQGKEENEELEDGEDQDGGCWRKPAARWRERRVDHIDKAGDAGLNSS